MKICGPCIEIRGQISVLKNARNISSPQEVCNQLPVNLYGKALHSRLLFYQ
jgi:hypothetical protein